MVKFVTEYFHNTKKYSIVRFIFEMYLFTFILKVILISLISLTVLIFESTEIFFFGDLNDTTSQFEDFGLAASLLIFCIIAPLFETVIGQALPIYIVAIFSNHKLIQIIVSSSTFTMIHSLEATAHNIIIFFAGLIFAWCFIAYKNTGLWKAILITAAVHSLYNFTGFLTYYSDFLIASIQFLSYLTLKSIPTLT